MKGKRLKKYRKEMRQYQLNFGFREPFQALCDSEVLVDAERQRIDLIGRLRGVLGGEVKIMVSQCSMRHLYNAKPKNESLITHAKNFERKRCGHHELEEPLDTHDCLTECIGPSNKHRYVVVTQDVKTRASLRKIPGVPIIYIAKSVVLLEPMAEATEDARAQEERAKFRAGLKGRREANTGQKRKRDDEEDDAAEQQDGPGNSETTAQKKKRSRGPKQPNPLSMKKSKKQQPSQSVSKTGSKNKDGDHEGRKPDQTSGNPGWEAGEAAKRKRRRKHKPKGDGQEATTNEEETAVS